MPFQKGRKKTGGRTKQSGNPDAVLRRDMLWAHRKRGKQALLNWSKSSITAETKFYELLAKVIPSDKATGGGVTVVFKNDLKEKADNA